MKWVSTLSSRSFCSLWPFSAAAPCDCCSHPQQQQADHHCLRRRRTRRISTVVAKESHLDLLVALEVDGDVVRGHGLGRLVEAVQVRAALDRQGLLRVALRNTQPSKRQKTQQTKDGKKKKAAAFVVLPARGGCRRFRRRCPHTASCSTPCRKAVRNTQPNTTQLMAR